MATCDPSTLLAQGTEFQRLEDRHLEIVQATMIQQWAGNTQTASQILADGIEFQKLDEEKLDIVIAQLLCEINGSIA